MVAAPTRVKFDLGQQEKPIDCLKVLPYLWQGGQFNKAMHIAMELDVGTPLVRSRASKLIELGIAVAGEDDNYELTQLGQDFCTLLYGALPKAKTVVSKIERNLVELALEHAEAHPDKNKGRIELLRKAVEENADITPVRTQPTGESQEEADSGDGDSRTGIDHQGDSPEVGITTPPSNSNQEEPPGSSSNGGQNTHSGIRELVPRTKEFYRLKNGLHPVEKSYGEHTIACHELPVEKQIELCRQRISQQQWRLNDLKLAKPAAAAKLRNEVEQFIKEELSRISNLSFLLNQPAWVMEAEKELNNIQSEIDNCSLQKAKAKGELKKSLEEVFLGHEQAFKECIARYTSLAADLGYRLNYQEHPGEVYNYLTVWIEEQNAAEQESAGRGKPETTRTTGVLEGTSRSNTIGAGESLLPQPTAKGDKHRESTPETNGDRTTSLLSRQGQDVVREREGELTPDEEQEKLRLERKVESGLYLSWSALREIHDRKLYRPQTWEAYCISRFGYKSDNAEHKLHAADAYEVLEKSRLISSHCLPTSEQQVRALRSLPEEQWVDIWAEAIEQTNGKKPPSGRIVRDIVERIKGKPKPELKFLEGDVVIISRPIKYSGCWGVVREVGEYTLSVSTWKELVVVEDPSKVTRLDNLPKEKASILEIWQRCKALRECPDLDPAVWWVLEGLGRQTFLTELQENLLTLFESRYLD